MTLRSFFPRLVIWIGIFLAAFSGALAILFESGVLTPSVVEAVDRGIAGAGLSFHAAALQWRPWSGLGITDVLMATRAAPDSGRAARRLVSVRRIEVGYRFTDILRGNLRFSRVKVVGPDVDLDALLDWSATMSGRAAAPTSGPVVRVEDLRLEDGRVRGQHGDLLAKLTLDGKLEAGRGTWHATIGKARTRLTLGRFDEHVELSGGMGMAEGLLALDDVRIAAAGGTIGLRGKLDPRGRRPSEIFLRGDAVPLEKVGDWLGVEHPLLFTELACEMAATGRPDSLRLSGNLAGRHGDDVERKVSFAGTRVGSRLALEAFRFSAESSLVDLTGQLDFRAGPSVDGVAVFRHLAPAIALADSDLSVIKNMDGVIRFSGTGLTRRSFRGTADVRIEDANVFGLDVGNATLQVSLDAGALSLGAARVSVGGAELRGTGTISADDRVDARFAGNAADLVSLMRPTGELGKWVAHGSASAELRLSGPLAGPALDATLHLEDAEVAGIDAGALELSVTTDRIGPEARWDFRVRGSEVGYGERRFERFAAEGAAQGRRLTVRSAELESASGGLRFAGTLDAEADGRLLANVERLELRAATDVRWNNNGTVRIERTPASVVITGVDLRGGGGSLTGRASFDSSGTKVVRATGRAVDLAVLAPFVSKDKALAGRIDFDADASLGAREFAGDVRLEVAQGRWGERAFDRLSGRVAFRDDRAMLQDIELAGPAGRAHIAGEILVPAGGLGRALADSAARAQALEHALFRRLDARVEAADLAWLWKRIPRMPASGGGGTVSLRLDGPFLGPSAELRVAIAGGTVGAAPLDTLAADATFDGEVLTVSYGSLRAGGGEIAFSGVVPLAWTTTQLEPRLRAGRAMDLRLDAQHFPLGGLATLIPLFRQLQGDADAKLALKGEPGALGFEGDFTIANGRLTIPTFVDPLVDGAGAGKFDAKGLELASARFSDGHDGVVEGRGRVGIQNLRVTDYDLDFTARDYHYHSSFNGIRGVGTGTLQIVAAKASDGRIIPNYQGSFRASRADIGEQALMPPSSDAGGVELPPGVVAPPEESKVDVELAETAGPAPPAAFLAEVRVRGDRNLWVETPEMDCEVAGDITFRATETAMGITGTVHTLRGTYSVLNTRFDVTRAEVEFVDPADPGASYIDAEATTKVLDENVTATVTGTVLLPQIHLTTESGMSEAEIYELLALRIKRGDGTSTAQEQGVVGKAFRDSYVAAITNRFGGELAREFRLDTFAYEEGEAGVPPSVTVGKNVGRDFFFKYKQAVGGQDPAAIDPSITRESLESPERALTVEYRLNEMFLLQGETGTLPQGDDYLNVDLRAEWGY